MGRVEIVKYLLDKGASANIRCNDGKTPLLMAVAANKEDVVRELIECDTVKITVKEISAATGGY